MLLTVLLFWRHRPNTPLCSQSKVFTVCNEVEDTPHGIIN